MNKKKHIPILAVMTIGLLAAMLLCTRIGVIDMGWGELIDSSIFWQLRLPRVILSVLVGGALAVCGATYQSVFRNPLTDPYVLGISSGAALGAAIAIIMGLQSMMWGVGGAALAAGLLTVVLIYKISSIGNRMHTTTLLLTGTCFTFLCSAIISFLMVLHQNKMESIIFWTMGGFSGASWTEVWMLLPIVLVGSTIVTIYGKELNLLLAGSETAQSLGVEVEKVKRILLGVTTLMVAFAVSTSGVIGFVGLIVPHAVRLVTGPDNRKVIPYSVVCGGLLMLVCDTIARTLMPPAELPVGAITALIGAPMFVYLLYKNKKRY